MTTSPNIRSTTSTGDAALCIVGYGVRIVPRAPCRADVLTTSPPTLRVSHITSEGARGAELTAAVPVGSAPVVHRLAQGTAALDAVLDLEQEGPLHEAWRIETVLCSTCWPAGFALVAAPDARALIDFVGRERSLLFVQGPLPLASMPPLGSMLEPAQKLLEHAREGDVERMRVAYDDDGEPWVQEHRVVKLNAWAALIVTMQAPAALADVTSAAAEELTGSIVSLQD